MTDMLFQRKPALPPHADQSRFEARLEAAEGRAERAVLRASWLHVVITGRDKQNHWREGVEKLLGGHP